MTKPAIRAYNSPAGGWGRLRSGRPRSGPGW